MSTVPLGRAAAGRRRRASRARGVRRVSSRRARRAAGRGGALRQGARSRAGRRRRRRSAQTWERLTHRPRRQRLRAPRAPPARRAQVSRRPRVLARVWAVAFCWAMADAVGARAGPGGGRRRHRCRNRRRSRARARPRAPAGERRRALAALSTGWIPPTCCVLTATATPAAVRAWVDITAATRARLYFATRSAERFLVRDLDLSGRFNEVDRAALTEVLESSIGALIADERAGLTRAEAEAADRAPRAAVPATAGRPRPAAATTADARPAAAAVAMGARVLLRGPGRGRWRDNRSRARPDAVVHPRAAGGDDARDGQGPGRLCQWPVRLLLHEQARIGVALYTVATRAGVECGPLWWSRLRVRLGVGADFVHVSPESTDPAATLTPQHWSTDFVATAALRANVDPSAGSLLALRHAVRRRHPDRRSVTTSWSTARPREFFHPGASVPASPSR